MNLLLLTRKTNPDGNSIYNSYTTGITHALPHTTVVDYFDLYFEKGKAAFEAGILEIVRTQKIDTVLINFVSGDLTFDLFFLERLAKECYMIMNFFDSELFFEPIDRYYAQCADLVLLPTASHFVYSYTLLNIPARSIFSLFDTHRYTPLSTTKEIDVSFVGDVSKLSRRRFLDALQKAGYKVEVFGYGSPNGCVSFDQMIAIFNRSKINLNFSDTIHERTFNFATNTNYRIVPKIMQYMTQIKGRSIEAALCKGFVLSQYATGLEELFSNEEIAWFESEKALIERVAYYLSHEEEREKMAQKAYEKALERYDARKAFEAIFASIDLSKRTTKTLYSDRAFEQNYATHHALYFFNFLFKGKWSLCMQELKLLYHASCLDWITVISHLRQQFRYQIVQKYLRRFS
jgi:spore maturation protein CgeB